MQKLFKNTSSVNLNLVQVLIMIWNQFGEILNQVQNDVLFSEKLFTLLVYHRFQIKNLYYHTVIQQLQLTFY